MSVAVYVTHPEVQIDADVPVPQWGLSKVGRTRAEELASRNLFHPDTLFISSTETKALELASILAGDDTSRVISDVALGENDRSATGFLPSDQFEAMADRFFAHPEQSAKGWERAIDAQSRVVAAVERILSDHAGTPLVFCGHGAVGTLLKCHAGNRPIDRRQDQQGGGNIHVFDLAAKAVLCEWTRMEDWKGL